MSAQRAFPVPRSAEGITELLKHLNLVVPDREGYLAISQTEGSRFATAVAKVANKSPDAEASLEYVRNVVLAAHPDARTAAAVAGFKSVEPMRLIDIGKKEGRSFRNAVRLVLAGGERSEQASALAYLQNLFEEYALPSDGLSFQSEPSVPVAVAPADAQRQQSEIREFPAKREDRIDQITQPTLVQKKPTAGESPAPQWGESFHVYGAKTALCFSECLTRQDEKATVMVEAAKSRGDSYDWATKLSLMFTVAELPLVLGLFMGYLDVLELKGHGKQNEKAVTLANQGNQFFISMIARGQPPRAAPMLAKDSYPVITMLLRQMGKNDPNLSADLILSITRRICDMHSADRKPTKQDRYEQPDQ